MEDAQLTIPLFVSWLVVVLFWIVIYIERKHPNQKKIELWPLRFVDFDDGPDKFNALVDSILSKPGYKLGFRDAGGVYFTEPFLKWNRMGLGYYVYLDEARKLVICHYRTYSAMEEAVYKAVSGVLAHFATQNN
jgi:hypothetical protein